MSNRIILQCSNCNHQHSRKDVDPYTGHMYDSKVAHECPLCRGIMVDVSHREGAVCFCDATLRDIDNNLEDLVPYKIWRLEDYDC